MILLEFYSGEGGIRMTLIEWAEKTGQSKWRLFKRLARDWGIERALST